MVNLFCWQLALIRVTQLSLLLDLHLLNSNLLFRIFGFLQRCTTLTRLTISVVHASNKLDIQHKVEYDGNSKMDHLQEVKFEGLTASDAELELIQFVLCQSTVLQKMILQFVQLEDDDSNVELKLQKELNGFRRASPKARLVFLD